MRKNTIPQPRRHIKALVFINIGIQAAFPVALAATPAVVYAGTEKETPAVFSAETYIIGDNETISDIAAKNNIPVEALEKLNKHRRFTVPFQSLSAGDEIDIPLQRSALGQKPAADTEMWLAGSARALAPVLQNNTGTDALADMARSHITGQANSALNREIDTWLDSKGKVQTRLDVDRRFTLKNSQIDALLPVWENPAHLVFTQLSLHRTDDRTQSNTGLGYRYFAEDYTLGANTFYDHDWSRSHSRLGAGTEYQRDFFKAGLNGYFRLSRWKDSGDLSRYEERPANGWDIRAEGYLPDYPGLGGKLIWEQYYGDNVGLFGKDNLQKDPYAATAGVNYSPFPLLKFDADHRLGKGGKNDSRFGVSLNYALGVPLDTQLDSSELTAARSLSGSRYDFVGRNNNIVLEYRKKETITLQMASGVSGFAGEKKSLGVVINTTNGVSRIDWNDTELTAAGGKIIQDSAEHYSVVMPDFAYGEGARNSYPLTAVAYDLSGQASPQAGTTITVSSDAVSPGNSQLSPSLIVLPDDGTSQSPLTLTLNSAADKPVQGVAAEIAVKVTPLNRAAGTDIRISAFTEDSHQPGVYHAVLTAGTQKGEFLLTPELQGAELSPARAVIGKAPSVSQLMISGTLALGEALSGHYQFDGNNMGAADASRYQWGDEGQTAPLNDAAVITVSGTVPAYTLVSSDAGKVKELSVQARNELDITGNTLTVNTRPGTAGNNTGGGNGGAIVNETAAPEISDLQITGTLAVGEVLSGTYVFNPLTGNPEDNSRVAWGGKGTTDPATGTAVTTSQILPPYTLTAADAGKVLAVSVLAKNGAGVNGNTLTVTTEPGAPGNNTGGGNGGLIINDAAAPEISDLQITGTLAIGEVLGGTYVFNPLTGNPEDKSLVAWGGKGTTDPATGTAVTASQILPPYTLTAADAGKVLAVSVLAKNGAGVGGNTLTATTEPGTPGNNTGGGNGGAIINETAAPEIRDLQITGILAVGEALNGTYAFNPLTGNPEDKSLVAWGDKGTTEAAVASGTVVTTSGMLPSYTLKAADAGKVLAVSVRAKNGAGVDGNTLTATTEPGAPGNNSGGGNNGAIVNETSAPEISDLQITGTLAVGKALSGTYVFNPLTGNPEDNSRVAWGEKGTTETAVTSGTTVTVSGTLPSYTLKAADAGKVLAVSVLAKNGADVVGNTLTATTEPGTTGNNTGGGNGGIITGGSLNAGNLKAINNNSLADGVATNSVQALVTNTDGSPVSGQIVSFTATNGAEITPEIGSTGADGIVSVTLTSTRVGTSAVTATVNGSSQTVNVTFVEAPVLKDISVNGHTFTLSDGFPTTGFAGASFKLTLSSGSAGDYNWSARGNSWVSVDGEGNVTFTGKGNATPVTITATPKNGGRPLTYTFIVKSWFINDNRILNFQQVSDFCTNEGMSMATPEQLTSGAYIRGMGSLWSEWGKPASYSGAGFTSLYYWTSEISGSGTHYNVDMNSGTVSSNKDSGGHYPVCIQ
ncbi:TPA: inverse autotransporter beta domain-containing protein [Morganella morganii]|nr:inverse autotransporter beta domain-containing protein [Morganella morganii]